MLAEVPRRRTSVTVPGVVGCREASADVWGGRRGVEEGKHVSRKWSSASNSRATHVPRYSIWRTNRDDLIEAGPADRVAGWVTDGSGVGRGYTGESGGDENGD